MTVRVAGRADALAIGRLLDAFNREFGEPTPGPEWLGQRVNELQDQDTIVLLAGGALESAAGGALESAAGAGPHGLAVLRFRPALWTPGLECYLAELYVVPERRGQGIGRALMTEALATARRRGADRIELGTSEDDRAAIALYESLGFVNRERAADGPVMYVYEREL